MEGSLKSVRRVPLWRRVADEIRRAILERQIDIGEHLAENELAERMQVSRGPVREALRQLELEGLVEVLPSGRTVVVGLAREGIIALFDARLALELHAVGRAAERVTLEDIARLQGLIDEMNACAKRGAASRFIQTDNEFHEQLFVVSGNRILTQLRQTLTPSLSVLMETELTVVLRPGAFGTGRVDSVDHLHQEILDAVARGDAEEARAAMRAHLDGARDILLAELAGQHLLSKTKMVESR